MRRRGFLGRLLAIAAAPLVVAGVELRVAEPYGASLREVTDELKRMYPPGFFEEIVNQESAFLRELKRR